MLTALGMSPEPVREKQRMSTAQAFSELLDVTNS
jgi:hypothetical protein